MPTEILRRVSATVAGAAAAAVAVCTTPAHADTTVNYLTLEGSTFQVGQPTTVLLNAPYFAPNEALYDTTAGVTSIVGLVGGATTGPITLRWTPATPGTHQIYVAGEPSTLDGAPPAPAFGPITVTVNGTGSTDPVACGDSCLSLHGTPEVGCTLTIGLTEPSASPMGNDLLGAGSAVAGMASGFSGGGDVSVDGTNFASAPATIVGPSTVQWTPTTPGTHVLQAYYQSEQEFSARLSSELGSSQGTPSSHQTLPMWVQVAPAGTTSCAAAGSTGSSGGPSA